MLYISSNHRSVRFLHLVASLCSQAAILFSKYQFLGCLKNKDLRLKTSSESQKLRPKTPSKSQKLRPYFSLNQQWCKFGKQSNCLVLVNGLSPVRITQDNCVNNNAHHLHQPT